MHKCQYAVLECRASVPLAVPYMERKLSFSQNLLTVPFQALYEVVGKDLEPPFSVRNYASLIYIFKVTQV